MQTKLGFDCKTCRPEDKEIRGCFTKSRAPVMVHGVKGSRDRCPVIDYFEVKDYLSVYRYWKLNQYPNEGTWAQQPNKLVEAMEHLDGIVSESS